MMSLQRAAGRLFPLAAIALAACMLLSNSAGAAVVIDEDFSSGAGDFTVVAGGTWSVTSGRYVVSNPGNAGLGLLGNISVHDTGVADDYSVAATVHIVGSSTPWNDAALIFGYQDANNYYYVSLNESDDGDTKGIFKVVSGTPTQMFDLASLSVSSDTDYDVEVDRSGNSIVVRINNSQVANFNDSTFTGGKFGFGTKNDSAQFDDLLVETDSAPVATTYQGEDYTSNSGASVATNHSGYTGSGFIDYGGNGTWIEWNNVNVGGSGAATLTFRYANGSGGNRQCAVTVNSSGAGNVSFAPTGGWTTWSTAVINVNLASGSNTIRVTANTGSGGPNLDKMDVALDQGGGGSGDTYYVDPSSGNMSNPGTSAQPWSTLEAVFDAGKTFNDGDVIYLRSGYHGHPTITGNPAGTVVIQPQSGHNPTAKKVVFDDASNFTLRDLEISPEIVSSYERGNFVTINSDCSDIVVEDCLIYSAQSISGWTAQNWLDRSGTGIVCSAPDCQIIGNTVRNVRFGINLTNSAEGSVCSYNTVENFAADGIRGLGNYQVFEYNLIMNSFDVDGNHDDGFQAWTNGPGGVGSETLYGTVLRGNVIISYTDPNQPLKSTLQGIGCFDGFFEDWVVENNIVCVDQWHGISFYGAINCRFINNTVVENPIAAFSNAPWLGVFAHKTRGASSGNIVRNNLVRDLNIASGSSTVDHNIESTNYTSHFIDYSNFDFHLKSTSSAVDAGSSSQAPSLDFEEEARDANPDIGADEL